MLGMIRKAAVLFAIGALAACSMQGAIDAMVSDEDRAMAEEFIDDIRDGNLDDLREEVDPDIWSDSEPQFRDAQAFYPEGDSETRIIAYSVNSDMNGGGRRTTKAFTLVTTDDEFWTITEIDTLAINGRQRVTRWNVEGSDSKPEELETLDSVGSVLLWASIIGLVFLIAVVALIVWLVRRSRRNMRAAPGTIPPAPPVS